MLGFLFALVATMIPSGRGPIPQRIGAKLTYEAMVSIPSSIPDDSTTSFTTDLMDVQYSIKPIRVRRMRVDVEVVDSTRTPDATWWSVTVRASGHPQPESLQLVQQSDGRWKWSSWSCLFPVDAEFNAAEPPDYDINRGGVLAMDCSDRFFGTAERHTEDRSSPLRVFGSRTRDPLGGGRELTSLASARTFVYGMTTHFLEPRKALHRDGVGWIRVEDRDVGLLLRLVEVDDVPIPRDWVPDPPDGNRSPEDSVRALPVAGDLWMWKRVDTSWLSRVIPPDSLEPLDTMILEVTHASDSSGWRILRCRSWGGLDDPSLRGLDLRVKSNDSIAGDLDSLPSIFRNTLIRPKQCRDKDTCYVGVNYRQYWPGQSPLYTTWFVADSGFHWDLGKGVTFEGSRNRSEGVHGRVQAGTHGWAMIHSPGNPPPATTSVRSTPRQAPRSLVDIASENPRAVFAIWGLDGTRQELTGSNLAHLLPAMRGPVLWSARLDGILRTGKHIRP